MIGHKKDTKTHNYLGMKNESATKYTLGNKDSVKHFSNSSVSNHHDSSKGIYNSSNSNSAQNEPLKYKL